MKLDLIDLIDLAMVIVPWLAGIATGRWREILEKLAILFPALREWAERSQQTEESALQQRKKQLSNP